MKEDFVRKEKITLRETFFQGDFFLYFARLCLTGILFTDDFVGKIGIVRLRIHDDDKDFV